MEEVTLHAMSFEWDCPVCGHTNEIFHKPQEIGCEECNNIFIVTDYVTYTVE